MRAVGQVIVLGLIAGGIYGLFATGVVLVYRGTGAINFAQGEVGTASLFVAWWTIERAGMPWAVGALAAIAFAALIGIGFERLALRPMVKASRVSITVATVGLLSLILAVELRFLSASPRAIPPPVGGIGVRLFGIVVTPTQLWSLVAIAVVGVVLGALLRRTDFGLGVLAVAQDPDGARLMGVPLNRVSAFVWGTAAALSALGGLLIAPTIGLFAPGFASVLFLKGLAAAVVGGLSSMQGAFVGGIAIGIIEAAIKRGFRSFDVPGIEILTIFGVVLLILVLRPHGILRGVRAREAT